MVSLYVPKGLSSPICPIAIPKVSRNQAPVITINIPNSLAQKKCKKSFSAVFPQLWNSLLMPARAWMFFRNSKTFLF